MHALFSYIIEVLVFFFHEDGQKNFRICSHEALTQPGQRRGNCFV